MRPAVAQPVEGQARDHGGQPRAQVIDARRVDPPQAQPRVLDRVLRVADRAEQPVRHGPQVRAVGLEALGEELLSMTWSWLSSSGVTTWTREERAM